MWTSHLYTYIPSLSSLPPNPLFHLSGSSREHRAELPVLNSPTSYFTHGSVCMGEGHGTPLQSSCLEKPMDGGAWWAAVHGVVKSHIQLSDFTFTFHFPALKKEMATHSSVLAWRIPGTGEPGGLPSMGTPRVRHHWSDLAAATAYVCQYYPLFSSPSLSPTLSTSLHSTSAPLCLPFGSANQYLFSGSHI